MREDSGFRFELKQQIQKIPFINEPYTKWKWRERKVSYGKENPDKIFFIIRRASCKVGLFSHVMTNMGLVDYAVRKGYIPVIDMQNTGNTYLEPAQVGKINAWEFYFKQPMGYGLMDIANSKNIILSDGMITRKNDYPDIHLVDEREKLLRWREVFRNYFAIEDSLLAEFQIERKKLFENKRVLGVLARGTDYVNLRPHNHPVQPTAMQVAEKVRKVMDKYSCTYIFLATEDKAIYDVMKTQFGDKLLTVETTRYITSGKENINDMHSDRNEDKYLKGKEYLVSVWLLSKCNCLVAGNVGGTHGALLMSPGYEYSYIFDLGLYP
ncbi:O-fucosyltransferase family protein [Parablautia muri]|uniref:Uncharacterized protein n=1 Tax=Parablautia muri TaxID=2320879 RepID=A0A9X5BCI4_9FIRM|nr:hypothetical protein [Parablautia muri]NBJ91320.1 hypothetical protein [Parablautia muri]